MKVVNRKVAHEYEVLEEWEAGIMLTGAEVKSAKKGDMSLAGSRVMVKESETGGEVFVVGMQINAYENAAEENYDPSRSRKLLLKREEIARIKGKMATKGLTLVPVSCYNKGRLVKVKIALVRGRKQYEKREKLKKRDVQRKLERTIKSIK